jgi:hypothetical protein
VSGPVLHVVGAGVAGLAAALAGSRQGRTVLLHEATGQAGGRCRSVEDDATGSTHDNGTHVLLGANRAALGFLDEIGASDLWVEPEPAGLPIVDLDAPGVVALVALSPWSWLSPGRRPPGLGLGDLARLALLALPGLPDRPVAQVMGAGPFARAVIEPLTVAALNTPPAEASARRLARVLRRVLLPGAGRLLVARRGLGPDLVAPALATLARAGVVPTYGRRLRGVETDGDGTRAARLAFADAAVPLGPGDEVVLALPPAALARLLPNPPPLPDRYEPIVNIHYAAPYPADARVRFVGLLGGLGQWVLFRPGTVSVTVSAARDAVGEPAEALAARAWGEVREAAARLGLASLPAEPPPNRVVKEKRATVSQPAGDPLALPTRRPLANVALAGDWLSPLPATIEAAVASGVAAVRGRSWPSYDARAGALRPPRRRARPTRHVGDHARATRGRLRPPARGRRARGRPLAGRARRPPACPRPAAGRPRRRLRRGARRRLRGALGRGDAAGRGAERRQRRPPRAPEPP